MRHKNTLLLLLILLLVGWVIIPQLDALKEGVETLKSADKSWVLLAIVLYFLGVPTLAVQFTVLSFKKLVYVLTLRVQGATLFVNKILPNGLGTISLNYFYFVQKQHTPSQATSVITVNAVSSAFAYGVLIIFSLVFSSLSLDGLFGSASIPLNAILFILLLVIGAVVTLMYSKGLKDKITAAWKSFEQNIATYRHRPQSLAIATVFNGMGTSLNVLTLLVCAMAIGIDISFADALLAYTFGNIATALVPTPGGIGSAEMGIYSGLVLVGLGTNEAISITLLYRLVSFWLPILPGYYFFWSLRKDVFAGYSVKSKTASI